MKKDVKNTEKLIKEKKVKKVDTKKVEKVKKENVFKRIAKYFKGVSKEVKRIRWINGKDLIKYSIASVIFVLFLGLYFFGIDQISLLIRSWVK